MATHSSILAWEIPWAEEPGRLQSMGSQRVGHDLAHKPWHTGWQILLKSSRYFYITTSSLQVVKIQQLNMRVRWLCLRTEIRGEREEKQNRLLVLWRVIFSVELTEETGTLGRLVWRMLWGSSLDSGPGNYHYPVCWEQWAPESWHEKDRWSFLHLQIPTLPGPHVPNR